MVNFASRYFGQNKHELGPETMPQAELQNQRRSKVEGFIASTGMPRWLAKIAFYERIQIIWESDEKRLQVI